MSEITEIDTRELRKLQLLVDGYRQTLSDVLASKENDIMNLRVELTLLSEELESRQGPVTNEEQEEFVEAEVIE